MSPPPSRAFAAIILVRRWSWLAVFVLVVAPRVNLAHSAPSASPPPIAVEAPEPLFDLGQAEAQRPGHELRAMAWFHAYLALAPGAANAEAVRGQIKQVDARAMMRVNEVLAMLKEITAHFFPAAMNPLLRPGTSGGEHSARVSLDELEARLRSKLAAPIAVPPALPADVPFTAVQRAQVWVRYASGPELETRLVSDFQPLVSEQRAGSPDGNWLRVFVQMGACAEGWVSGLVAVRNSQPEADFIRAVLGERARPAEAAAALARAEQIRQDGIRRWAAFEATAPDLTAFLTRFATETGITLMPIPAGEFTMGSLEDESRIADERPTTQVKISRPFFLSATEITQAQWRAVMGRDPDLVPRKGDNLPVEFVSWLEAMTFCRKLTDRERGRERLPTAWAFTLPTEAQWEYACRAGTTGAHHGEIDTIAWFVKNARTPVSTTTMPSGATTFPVATKHPNAWGLHDMSGNVLEWCFDWYASRLAGGTVIDPVGPPSGSKRVARGGCYANSAFDCRSAKRHAFPPLEHSLIGVRLALSVSP